MRFSQAVGGGWLVMLVVSCGLWGCGTKPSDAQDRTAAENPTSPAQAADKVQLQILDYDAIRRLLAGHRGKVVVLDAWATSCEPCIREFPGLVALSKKYPKEKLACVSLSFDYYGGDSPEELKPQILAFLEKQGATFDNILSSTPDSELYKKFEFDSIPAVFVYDREGKLARRFDNDADGEFTYADIEPFVAKLVDAE